MSFARRLSMVTWVAAFASIGAVWAAPAWIEYTPASFAAAQTEGQTILVDVHATWCPDCKVQGPILDELRSEAALQGITFMKVDFDKEKDFLREHKVPRQSTILVFQGHREVARSVAETNRDRLRAFVLSSAAH